jgi:hypothetical protein
VMLWLLTKSQIIKVAMTAWRAVVMISRLNEVVPALEAAREKLGRRAASLHLMKKAELVALAVNEMGLTYAKAEKETVDSLRFLLRTARKTMEEAAKAQSEWAIPAGLARMSLATLLDEATRRSLETMRLKNGKIASKTRDQLIYEIRLHAAEQGCGEPPPLLPVAEVYEEMYEENQDFVMN